MRMDTFFDDFDLLAHAPNGVQKLREMILQLAVQGKLVPQDPNDEPASVLLEKIKAEKDWLLKEGRINKGKPLPSINSNEAPYELPIGWEWVRLDNISTNIHYGYTASANNSIKDVRLLRITDIQNGLVDWKNVPGCEIDKSKVDYYVLNSGDLLIARTGGTIGKTFLVEDTSVCAVFASYLIRIIPSRQIYPQYIKYFATSPLYWEQLYAKCSGTGQPNVNATSLKTLITPLPPLNEQKRIVNKIDELMALCDEQETRKQQVSKNCIQLNDVSIHKLLAASESKEFSTHWQRICDNFDLLYSKLENVTKLRQAILQLAVQGKLVPQDSKDEPASVLLEKIRAEKKRLAKDGQIKKVKPLAEIGEDENQFLLNRQWTWARLNEIVFLLGDGIHGTPNYTSGTECYFINGNNLTDGEIVIKPNTKTVSLYEIDKYQRNLTLNTVLVSINGTLGRVAFYNNEKIMLGKSVCYFNLPDNISKHFIKIVLESPYFIKYAYDKATGSTIKNLSLKAMNNFPVPLPPFNEQKRIVSKVHELMDLCDELETKLSKSQTDCDRLMEAAVADILAA